MRKLKRFMVVLLTWIFIVTMLQPIQKKEAYAEAVVTIYEAEDAQLPDGITPVTNGLFSGTGYVEGINDSSIDGAGVITYVVDAVETGTYILEMGYATTTNTKIAVSINNGDWQEVSILSTGDWSKVEIQDAEISLEEGKIR